MLGARPIEIARHVWDHHDRPVRTVLLGWGTFLLMTLLVVVIRGVDHLANMAMFAVVGVGVAMLTWVALRRSRPSLLVSLVVGVLHALGQVAYLLAGMTASHPEPHVLAVDVIGLVSGVLLVVGSVQSLRNRRARRHAETAGAPAAQTATGGSS